MSESAIINYWNEYYSRSSKSLTPSSFSEFIISTYPQRKYVIDVGCGSGRDAYLFASRGCQVLGLDASEQAIERAREHCRQFAASCRFQLLDIDEGSWLESELIESFNAEDTLIYARFFLHAISQAAEEAFLESIRPLVKDGALLCIECRSLKDAELPKVEGDHFRRFIDPESLANRCASLGMAIRYSKVGRGLARYGSEDPEIIRMIMGLAQ